MKKYQIDPKLNKAEDFEYKGSEDINEEIGLSDYGEDDLMNGVEDVSEEQVDTEEEDLEEYQSNSSLNSNKTYSYESDR